mmetsp:Transcript_86126/g.248682  ORF Transcript_86126/g.248682 Transcript_86126/m.248682 type:complete len:254 (-) Transcript_86126:46-807(-)
MLAIVRPRHPERAIVSIRELALLLHTGVLVPQVALVAPIAFPLATTPRVADLDQAERVATDAHGAGVHLLDVQDAVGVPLVQPVRAVGARCTQDAAQLVVLQHNLEHRVIVDVLATVPEEARSAVLGVVLVDQVLSPPTLAVVTPHVHPRRVAGHRPDRPDRLPALCGRVAAAELGEGLLEQHRPQFVAVGLREYRLANALLLKPLLVARDVVVDGEVYPLLLNPVVQPQEVLASWAPLLAPENPVDRAGVLC